MMSDILDLAPIKDRLAAITPGPWVRGKWPGDFDIVRQKEWTPCDQYPDHDDCAIAQAIHPADVVVVGLGHAHDRAKPNAEFIAHAPEDIAALIAEVEWLRSLVEG